jgi:hypothetical protein
MTCLLAIGLVSGKVSRPTIAIGVAIGATLLLAYYFGSLLTFRLADKWLRGKTKER